MSSRITLLFQALKTFVFIPQSVITFRVMLPPFLSLLQSLLLLLVFLHCGSSPVPTDKLIFSPSLCIFFSFITFVACFILQFPGWKIENQSASLQRNQIALATSDGPLQVPETACLEIPWVSPHCPAGCNMIISQMRSKLCVFSKDWTGCEGSAHRAVQPGINEHKLQTATVLWWGNAERGRVCLSHNIPRAGDDPGRFVSGNIGCWGQ